jgi:capsule polysaccharide modification protein KpsS
MKKSFISLALAGCLLTLASCSTVNYINTETLKENYEKKIHHTTLPGKVLFKFDKRKMDTYQNVQVFMNENEVKRPFEVVAYGSYTPITLPLIRPQRPRLEKYLLWKAARKARKLKANGVIIDNKNNFRVINLK